MPAQPESVGRVAPVAAEWIPGGSFRMGSAARQTQMTDTGMNHLGFRCVTRDNNGS